MQKREVIINLSNATYTYYRNGCIDENNEQLSFVTREIITLKTYVYRNDTFVDRINGRLVEDGVVFDCIRVQDISTTPKF